MIEKIDSSIPFLNPTAEQIHKTNIIVRSIHTFQIIANKLNNYTKQAKYI